MDVQTDVTDDSLPSMPDSPESQPTQLTSMNMAVPTTQSRPTSRVKAPSGTPPGSPPAHLVDLYRSISGPTTTTATTTDPGSQSLHSRSQSSTLNQSSTSSDPAQSQSKASTGSRRSPVKTVSPVVIEDRAPDYATATLKFCTVCASNNNRSMEAHRRLSVHFPTISFGTGSLVRLPGPSVMEPNVYKFNVTSYADIYNELESKDPWLYKANGLLPMLARNKAIKWGPERWQDWAVGAPRVAARFANDLGADGTEAGVVDVVITCEARCWDAVVEDLHNRGGPLNRPVHVINIDIKDNHEEAVVGGGAILDLAKRLDAAAKRELGLVPADGTGAAAVTTEKQREWDSGSGASRDGFDQQVPVILSQWQTKYPNLPAMWTLTWF